MLKLEEPLVDVVAKGGPDPLDSLSSNYATVYVRYFTTNAAADYDDYHLSPSSFVIVVRYRRLSSSSVVIVCRCHLSLLFAVCRLSRLFVVVIVVVVVVIVVVIAVFIVVVLVVAIIVVMVIDIVIVVIVVIIMIVVLIVVVIVFVVVVVVVVIIVIVVIVVSSNFFHFIFHLEILSHYLLNNIFSFNPLTLTTLVKPLKCSRVVFLMDFVFSPLKNVINEYLQNEKSA